MSNCVSLYVILWPVSHPIHARTHELSYNMVCCFYLFMLIIKGRFLLYLCCLGASFCAEVHYLFSVTGMCFGTCLAYHGYKCCLLSDIMLWLSLFIHVFPAHLDIVLYKVFCGLSLFTGLVQTKPAKTGLKVENRVLLEWVGLAWFRSVWTVTTSQTSVWSWRDAVGGGDSGDMEDVEILASLG